ncbi:exopolygalacturonase-like [Momordica charantia]|uniref:Exopolygalacturonase-like n=1 Tax=Momordica charantia TaxID=3673 RepID=A0A6J1C8Y3_MOMCH|nr:exopolygalacturonase-like [Momordica charantia]
MTSLSFLLTLLLLALVAVNADPPPIPHTPDPFKNVHLGKDIKHRNNEVVFNVLNYGAKADGKTDSSMNLIRTWVAACHSKGAARVVIPSGTFFINQVVFAGPCTCLSPIIVQIDAVLKGGTDLSEFVSDEWILFEKINGLIVTGRGTLDGQGGSVWKYNDCGMNPDCTKLAVNLKLNGITHGLVKGITSTNSKGFHMFITNSQGVRVRRMHITAPEDSPNTDGIHLSRSNNVKISRSVIATGDDCISIGRGSTNVVINKVTCGPGHGISIGSLGKYQDEEDVRGVTVRNCTLLSTDNGLRIKTWPDSPPSAASGIIFQDINMLNVKNPILIDQEYSCSTTCKKPPSRVKISDVHFINVQGSSISPVAVNFKCSKQFPCQNIEMLNINLKYTGPPKANAPFISACTNAKVGYKGIQFPPPCK